MPKLIINMFGEKVIDWSNVQPKETEEQSEISLHEHQLALDFNNTPTLF